MFEDIVYHEMWDMFTLQTGNVVYISGLYNASELFVYALIPDIAATYHSNAETKQANIPSKKQLALYKLKKKDKHNFRLPLSTVTYNLVEYKDDLDRQCEYLLRLKNYNNRK